MYRWQQCNNTTEAENTSKGLQIIRLMAIQYDKPPIQPCLQMFYQIKLKNKIYVTTLFFLKIKKTRYKTKSDKGQT